MSSSSIQFPKYVSKLTRHRRLPTYTKMIKTDLKHSSVRCLLKIDNWKHEILSHCAMVIHICVRREERRRWKSLGRSKVHFECYKFWYLKLELFMHTEKLCIFHVFRFPLYSACRFCACSLSLLLLFLLCKKQLEMKKKLNSQWYTRRRKKSANQKRRK